MRITMILLFVGLMQAFATNTYSQNTKLSLKMEDASLESILNQIEKISEFHFFYKSDEISQEGRHNIDVSEQTVDEVLKTILENSNLSYKIFDKYIAIVSNKNANVNLSNFMQQKVISGKVTDSSGAPLPGVSVVVKGTTTGVITDMDGKYSLVNVPEKAILQFSFVGMKTQEIVVGGKISINVTLAEETVGIEEVVAVGYGTQRKSNLTGSVSAVKSEKLTIAPVSNVTNALGGQLPGIVTKQNSGQPGADAATLNIRGFGSPLVIVDGVESSLSNLDANQIETVSILKDGAASIYGARAGNGAILVTTKRGNNQKPIITVNSSTTLQGILDIPVAASAGQRAQMEREAHINSGQPESSAPWTKEAIAKFFAGDDPNYISSDWFNYTTRDWAPQQNHNFSIRGGSEKVKYYGMISYLDQETIIKKAGGGYKRYNIQTNMDASVAKNLTFSADLSVIYEDSKFSSRGSDNWFFDMYETKPYLPLELPDKTKPSWGGTATGSFFIASNMDLFGYSANNGRNMRSSASMVYDFPSIKGLKAKAFVNFIDNTNYMKNFARPATSYTYNPTTKEYTEVASANGTQASMSEGTARSSSITQQYSLTYENTFNGIHKVQGLALYEAIDYKNNEFYASRNKFLTPAIEQLFAGSTIGMGATGSGNQMGRASWVGRLNYSFRDKYLVETILRADASAKFASDKRWGYFPSISLGWVASNEEFMKNLKFVDNLKLRASYGQSGNDAVGNFQYLTGYNIANATYILGDNPRTLIYNKGIANPDLTWEELSIYNIGIDYSLLNRKIYGTLEGFYRLKTGIPGNKLTTVPSSFGASLPTVNLNDVDTRGFEFSIGTTGNIGKMSYDVSGNISWSRSKFVKWEEPEYTDPDQERLYKYTGNWIDRSFGYVSDGLFTSQSEIDALPYTYKELNGNSSLRPGDVKYLDTNGDKVLDWKDQKQIGKSTMPNWMYGFTTVFKYRSFDLQALFQGSFGYSTSVIPYNGGGPLKSDMFYKLRWTQEVNDRNSLVARIGGSASNLWASDFYLKNVGYLRLRNFSVGYQIPKQLLSKAGFESLRLYFAATNLFTISNISKYGLDPEMPGKSFYYPQQRTISLGINLSL